ncbi:hypothetical protein BX070DRAFT_223300, partial [Coemansia spiralis]
MCNKGKKAVLFSHFIVSQITVYEAIWHWILAFFLFPSPRFLLKQVACKRMHFYFLFLVISNIL